jgi:dTDP-4-dehydrorhamnose 3,5-epimerase
MHLFPGVQLIPLRRFDDPRGHFRECYKKPLYEERGIVCPFVQDNHSFSKKGVIRGMHIQKGQAKLITVMSGSIFDVFVDLRKDAPTFGKWQGIVLDAEESAQLFIPEGFAHGFAVLSDTAHVFYKVSAVYDPSIEKVLCFNDPEVGIQWPIQSPVLSERDAKGLSLEEMKLWV